MSRPVKIVRSSVIDAPIDALWRLLRDFNSHAAWHPAIAESHMERGEAGDLVGSVRAFRLADGSFLREQLIALSDRDRELTYCLIEAPIPLRDYVATLRLRPVSDGDRTFIQWESRFRPPEDRAEALSRLVAEGIYDAGFAALKQRFGGSSARSERPRDRPVPTAVEIVPPRAEPSRPPEGTGMESRAIIVERYGGPEVLQPTTVRVPPPGPGEVRIRHGAIGVNFIDVYCRTGFFSLLKPPGVPGMEGAGTILDVGPGVTHVRQGDRVAYACEPVGAYAAVRTMPAALLIRLPDDIDDATAAAIILKGLSVEFLIHRVHPVQRGEVVLIHAAAGGMGLLLCQWASALGAHVVGTVSSDEKAARALAAGAERAIVYSRQDFVAEIMRMTDGRGADVIYDGVGADTFGRSLEAAAIRGHIVSFGQASGAVGSWDIGAMAAKSLTVSRPNFGHYTSDAVELGEMADRLFDALRRGVIAPAVDRQFRLDEAAEAHRRLESRENVGAMILIP